MKMVNNGYVSRIPQDLKGTIEEIQGGGSGSGLVLEKILFYIATFGPASIPANTIHNFDTATSVTFYDPQTHGGYTLTPEEGAKTLFLPATGFQAGSIVSKATFMDLPMRYQPYDDKKQKLIEKFLK